MELSILKKEEQILLLQNQIRQIKSASEDANMSNFEKSLPPSMYEKSLQTCTVKGAIGQRPGSPLQVAVGVGQRMQRKKSRMERQKNPPEIVINNSDIESSKSNEMVRDQDLGTYPSFAKDLNDQSTQEVHNGKAKTHRLGVQPVSAGLPSLLGFEKMDRTIRRDVHK